MYDCDSWTIKKAECQRIDAFKLCGAGEDSGDLGPHRDQTKINLKGNQPWIFIGRTDAEAEAPILWPFDAKSWLTGKELDTGKDWRQEEKRVTEDENVEWHHWFNGHEYEQLQEIVKTEEACVHGVAKSWTHLSYWTTTTTWFLQNAYCFNIVKLKNSKWSHKSGNIYNHRGSSSEGGKKCWGMEAEVGWYIWWWRERPGANKCRQLQQLGEARKWILPWSLPKRHTPWCYPFKTQFGPLASRTIR